MRIFQAITIGVVLLVSVSSCSLFRSSISGRAISGRQIASYNTYISKYTDIALKDQKRYGIPASITLAQGLLESNAGCSSLAVYANNHFGIKCHRSWTGKRIYKDDDLAHECFRVYKSAADSYNDHAQFLRQRRYARLYRYKPSQYREWARGLQQCGYATDRGYANKLIKIIEDYQLYLIDQNTHTSNSSITENKNNKPKERPVYLSYGLLYVRAQQDDTLAKIAREFKMSERKLAFYNDFPEGFPIEKGDIIYLQEKNSKAKPPYYEHVVKVGESIHQIAQKYGIKLEALYKLNGRGPDYVPNEGDVLRLQ